MKYLTQLLMVVLFSLAAFSADPAPAPPRGNAFLERFIDPALRSSNEKVEALVVKVYSVKDGDHRFVAYAVRWKEIDVIVSDPLATSEFKVGDTIKFTVTKIRMTTSSAPEPISTVSFTLDRQNPSK